MAIDRTERLLNLLSALIDTRRPLGREDIRTRVPGYAADDAAFRRAFERDKETLRSMGVSIVMEPLDADYPDHGEGYRVPPEEYALPDPGLTREEMDALALAASAVKLKGNAAANALGKLGSDSTAAASYDVDLTDDARLTQLFTARSEHRNVGFEYKGKSRTIDPYRLSFRNGHWYINGFDHAYEDVRTYRLDRIDGEIALGPPNGFDAPKPTAQPWLQPWQLGDEKPVLTRVLIDPSQAAFAIEQCGHDSVVERKTDHSVVIELEVTNKEGLRAFVLGFLDHAEIVAPEEMRADMVNYLKSLVNS